MKENCQANDARQASGANEAFSASKKRLYWLLRFAWYHWPGSFLSSSKWALMCLKFKFGALTPTNQFSASPAIVLQLKFN